MTNTFGKLDFKPFISNAPLALIALPAAYGSAAFESKVYEHPWNIAIGIGVEAAYTGIIIFASRKSKGAFLSTALVAMLVGVIYNTLHAAGIYGLLEGLAWGWHWMLAIAHGAPLSILAFMYAMLMHYSSDKSGNAQPTADAENIKTMQEHIAVLEAKLNALPEVTAPPMPVAKPMPKHKASNANEPMLFKTSSISIVDEPVKFTRKEAASKAARARWDKQAIAKQEEEIA